jgi:hypothetical protein
LYIGVYIFFRLSKATSTYDMNAGSSVRSRNFSIQRVILHHDVGQLGISDLQEEQGH